MSKIFTKRVLKPLKRTLVELSLARNFSDKKECNRTGPSPLTSRDPPDNYKPEAFCHNAFKIPDYIEPRCFRELKSPDEPLGPCASKSADYKNAEYFAYHKYSFFDLKVQTITIVCNPPKGDKL